MTPTAAIALAETRAWLDRAVIGLNLCPFAAAVHARGLVRFVHTDAADTGALLERLCDEMRLLVEADAARIETTLLIHPGVLSDFLDYNDFLDAADAALEGLGYVGVLQVASFHPQYRFADAAPDDPAHATNRSPYPILHLLREASVERAVAGFPDTEAIYERNIETMRSLGAAGWAALQAACRRDAAEGPPGPRADPDRPSAGAGGAR